MGSPSSLVRRHILSGLLAITYTTLASRRGKGATDASNARLLHARPNASPATAAAAPLLWGYEGVVPGPTLEVGRGEEVWVRVINELPEATALHWHGVRLANAMDGAPPLTQQPILPGQSFDYRFIAPDAGTYWYHPPRPTRRGLYGMLVVHETEPVAVDRDAALIFDDWRGDDSAASAFTVNGAPSLDIRARQNERLRLRLLNASDEAIFAVRVDRLRLRVMAIDGQPAQPFIARQGRILLGPGNRADVFIDCTTDTRPSRDNLGARHRPRNTGRPNYLRYHRARPPGAAGGSASAADKRPAGADEASRGGAFRRRNRPSHRTRGSAAFHRETRADGCARHLKPHGRKPVHPPSRT